MKSLLSKYGIWILIILFTLAYSLIGILRYNHFLAGGYDLPHYAQAIWKYSQGLTPKVTIFGNIHILGDHFEPILILFASFYKIYPDPTTIIFLQALLTVVSVFPIYLFSKKIIHNIYFSFLPSLIYLLNPNLQYALDYDFHSSTIIVFPLTLFYYAYFEKKKYLYWLAFIFVVLTKEDGAIFALFLGLYQVIAERKKNQGIITILFSLILFFLIQFILMPYFYGGKRPATLFIDFYSLGKTISEIVKNSLLKPWLLIINIINNHEKIKTLLFLLGSFSFLPLLSPFSWLNSFPFIAEKFYSATESRWLFNQYHHVNILPVLAFGYLLTIKFLLKKNIKMTKVILLFSLINTLFFVRFWHLPITRLSHLSYYKISQQEKDLKKALKLIPDDRSVSAQFPFTSYLANRGKIYLFPEAENEVEYIVLTLNGLPTYPLSKAEMEKKIRNYRLDSRIKVIYEKEGTYFFQRLLIK